MMPALDDGTAGGTMLRRWLEYRADAGRALKPWLAADPDAAAPRLLQGYFLLLVGTRALHGRAGEEATAAAARAADAGERAHARALAAWAAGDLDAAGRGWDDALDEDPHDLLALRLQHLSFFWQGDAAAMRRSLERRLPAWDEAAPGRGFVDGMHAFALEETGEASVALALGRSAAEREPGDLWSIHAVAHVLDSGGRWAEGSAWLQPRLPELADRNPFRGHVAWHAALFALEQGDTEAVLAAYDATIRPGPAAFYLDIQNAAALLARLAFLGVDVGARWRELAELAEPRVADLVLPFTDLHVVLAEACGERADALERELAALRTASDPVRSALVRPIAEAIVAFTAGDPGRCVDLLLPLRRAWAPIGGSRTQRDVFAQLLLVAAVRAGRSETAQALLAERAQERPGSLLGKTLLPLAG